MREQFVSGSNRKAISRRPLPRIANPVHTVDDAGLGDEYRKSGAVVNLAAHVLAAAYAPLRVRFRAKT